MSIVYLNVELGSDHFKFTDVEENIYKVRFSQISEFIETYIHEYVYKNKEKKDCEFILRIYHKLIEICDDLFDGQDNLVIEYDIINDLYKIFSTSICYDKIKSRQLIDTSNERLKVLLMNLCNDKLNDSNLYDFKM